MTYGRGPKRLALPSLWPGDAGQLKRMTATRGLVNPCLAPGMTGACGHLCCQGAGRIIAGLSRDGFPRAAREYALFGGEWNHHVASNQA